LVTDKQLQDEEDAKRGMYNWFAQCQNLLTSRRMVLASLFTACVAFALLGAAAAAALLFMCCVIAVTARQYSARVIGGVVGDFLGATIAVAEILIYLGLAIDWQVWQPASLLCFRRDLLVMSCLVVRAIGRRALGFGGYYALEWLNSTLPLCGHQLQVLLVIVRVHPNNHWVGRTACWGRYQQTYSLVRSPKCAFLHPWRHGQTHVLADR
jgi:hypothetical protein